MISITLEIILKDNQRDIDGWWYRSQEGLHRNQSEYVYIDIVNPDFNIDEYIFFHQIRSLKIRINSPNEEHYTRN